MAVRQMLVAGRYRLLEPVGAGGMGRVWLARDEMLHRDVAIKEIVPPDWMTDAEKDRLRDRTLREARSAARLNHPHVVRIYDVVQHEGQSWIVMEYIASRSLHQVLQEEGPYDPAGAARIGLAVLDALDAAHRAGVLHRDVKPHNVLIGVDGQVVLTDFGLATFVDDGTVTAPGLIVGSPQYVSPERARDGASTVESDLWSLGATVYAAVEGRSPYARETAMATLAALATEPPDPPVRAGPLTSVLEGLLRYDPSTRLTAREVENRLRLIVAIDHREVPLVPGQRGVRQHRPVETHQPADSATTDDLGGEPPSVAPSEQTTVAPAPETPAGPVLPLTSPEGDLPHHSPPEEPDSRPDDAGEASTTPLHQGSQALVRVIPQPSAVLAGQIVERAAHPGRRRSLRSLATARYAVVAGVAMLLIGGSVSAGYLAQNSRPRAHVVLPPAPSAPVSEPVRTEPSPSGRSPSAASPSRAASASPSAPLPTTGVADRGGFAPVACDSPPQPGARVTPKKGAARGVNGWTLLAGWSYFTNGSGFHLAVPDGWTYRRTGDTYCFRDPRSSVVMSLDAGRDAGADPLQACHAEDLRLKSRSTVSGYALISITSVPLLYKAADWEFRYRGTDGGPRRASVRWFAVNGRAYVIGWSTPEGVWPDHLSKMQMVRSTFYADRAGRTSTAEADRG
ncbi:protein kinase [Actinoplanes sp. NPDC024001]|uniref:serine/threonine-protein kinase n=1 Tax=Actinoplanes sp. NPDC024001 TaxID=3154598 RepID=UPI0033FC6875